MKKMGIILQKALMMNFAIALGCSAILLNAKYFLQHVAESQEVVIVCDQFLKAYVPAILVFLRSYNQIISLLI